MLSAATAEIPRWPNGDQIRILVVDDEQVVALPLAAGMIALGVQAKAAHNAKDALARLSEDSGIGVVVTDIRMPGGDGLALAQTILAEQDDNRAVEVILITGHARAEDVATAMAAGAMDLLQKPFRLGDAFPPVLRAMARASERRRSALPRA